MADLCFQVLGRTRKKGWELVIAARSAVESIVGLPGSQVARSAALGGPPQAGNDLGSRYRNPLNACAPVGI
jgi:hypothetical protein